MNAKVKKYTLAAVAALVLLGCTNNSTQQNFSLAESKFARDLNPQVSGSQLKNLASDNNAFAFDMFAKLQETEKENIFFSPYSISEALAMTYAGAVGTTKSQMADVLHFDSNDSVLHTSFNALDLHLNYTDDNYTLSVANSLWGQKDYTFVEQYLDTIKINYGASMSLLNFAESEKSRQIINAWVEDKTQEKIKDLIPRDALSADTKLVLTNAIYFKGEWVYPFEVESTQNSTFNLLDGSTKQTPFMQQTEYFSYADSDNYQAIDLPYKSDKTSMLVILPKEGKFQEVANNIKNVYQEALNSKTQHNINLKMPKFEFTTGIYHLKKYFRELGMIDAFESNADFSNMSVTSRLFIDAILHKAFIKVDEKGTEAAAAATAVIMNDTSAGLPPIEMFMDRPFIFFIKDAKSDQVLFSGLIMEPKI